MNEELYNKCISCKSGYYVTERGFSKTFPEEYSKLLAYPFDCDVACAPFKIRLWHYINDLKSVPTTHCGKKRHFHNFRSGYFDFCGANCKCAVEYSNEKRVTTSLERYGVKSPKQTQEQRKRMSMAMNAMSDEQKQEYARKRIETVNKRYGGYGNVFRERNRRIFGVDNLSQVDWIKDKARATQIERYGGIGFASEELAEKARRTNLELYGTENPMLCDEVKERIKQTNLKLYGTEWCSSLSAVKEKRKLTNLELYGVENAMHNVEIAKRCGVRSSESKKIKLLKQHPDIIGVEDDCFVVKCDEDCECGGSFVIPKSVYFQRERFGIVKCTTRNPIRKMHDMQGDLLCFIKEIYDGTIVQNTRSVLDGKEIDIYLPELKIGFEFNGDYWHANPLYNKYDAMYLDGNMTNMDKWHKDIEKVYAANLKGISIYGVWEYEWLKFTEYTKARIRNIIDNSLHMVSAYTKLKDFMSCVDYKESEFGCFDCGDIIVRYCSGFYCNSTAIDKRWFLDTDKRVIYCYDFEINDTRKFQVLKSIIRHALGLTENRIYARKCELREISNRDARDFLNENSIFGMRNATTTLGLFYNNELVMVYSFGHNYYGRSKDIEIIRVCTKTNTVVVGGGSKCLKYYIDKYCERGDSLVFYVDKIHQDGSSLEGFEFVRHEFGYMNYWNLDYDDGELKGERGMAFSRMPSKYMKIKELKDENIISSVLTMGVDVYKRII